MLLSLRLSDAIASMGPRSGERGREIIEFADYANFGASMGPRSGERGSDELSKQSSRTSLLQWGRALVSAEDPVFLKKKAQVALASMGPRSGERGSAPSMSPLFLRSAGFNGAALW